jgi:type-F conjugative transfer system pilin assembly protein TrbC
MLKFTKMSYALLVLSIFSSPAFCAEVETDEENSDIPVWDLNLPAPEGPQSASEDEEDGEYYEEEEDGEPQDHNEHHQHHSALPGSPAPISGNLIDALSPDSKPDGYEEYLRDLKAIGAGSPVDHHPMSPAAARAYADLLRDQQRQTEMNRTKAEVTRDILEKAFGQGITEGTIDNFLKYNQEPDEYGGKHLLVFISSSMPDSSIKERLALLGDLPDTAFVLRGLIDNDISKIMPTQRWIRSLVCSGPEGKETCRKTPVDINPVLFERLKITEVPALVYVPYPENVLPSCEGEATDEDYLAFIGDLSPVYALEKFLQRRPQDTTLRRIFEDVSKKSYYQ